MSARFVAARTITPGLVWKPSKMCIRDRWIAMDCVDVVVHIFQTELRGFYRLEELWADAPMTKYEYEE